MEESDKIIFPMLTPQMVENDYKRALEAAINKIDPDNEYKVLCDNIKNITSKMSGLVKICVIWCSITFLSHISMLLIFQFSQALIVYSVFGFCILILAALIVSYIRMSHKKISLSAAVGTLESEVFQEFTDNFAQTYIRTHSNISHIVSHALYYREYKDPYILDTIDRLRKIDTLHKFAEHTDCKFDVIIHSGLINVSVLIHDKEFCRVSNIDLSFDEFSKTTVRSKDNIYDFSWLDENYKEGKKL